ncbi:SID1 transmembrane family member 1-like [Glandiceps talaboti]
MSFRPIPGQFCHISSFRFFTNGIEMVKDTFIITTGRIRESVAVGAVEENNIEADFGRTYQDSIFEGKQNVYHFSVSAPMNTSSAVRIHVNSSDTKDNYPILFVVRQQEGITSWEIPSYLLETNKYDAAARTLCPKDFGDDGMSDLYIEVSCSSSTNTDYTLVANIIDDFEMKLSTEQTIVPAPTKPVYYYYNFTDDIHSVQVRANSEDNICAILSIQNTRCPVFDSIRNVEFTGIYQTMTTQTAITIKDTDFENKDFYVVVVIYPDDSPCRDKDSKSLPNVPSSSKERMKTMDINIKRSLPVNEYWKPIVTVAAIFTFMYAIVPIMLIHNCRLRRNRDYGDGTDGEVDNRADIADSNPPEVEDNLTKFAQTPRETLKKKFRLYYWNLLPIAILYALPVIQLVLTHQLEFNKSGEQDVCYFNFLCANPLGPLSSFNNVFSNVGYVMLGILFLIVVGIEDYHHRQGGVDKNYGVPKHFGLLYAIGIALIMEGVCSGCYHVCPSYSNFQFDTSFMYTICGLLILKLYQNRHPDVLAHSHVSYLCLTFVICIALIGVVTGNLAMWICTAVIYIIVCVILSFKIYFVFEMDWKLPGRVLTVIRNDFCRRRPKYTHRFVLIIIGNLLNWSLALLGLITRPKDFATHLLTVFIANFILYLIFYIIMKTVRKEWSCPRVLIYLLLLVLTIGFWTPALYFFTRFLAQWGKTPAESREGNRDCIWFDFYDHHDVWHLLSACGLFISFITILYMDDGLDRTKRREIHVF